MVVNDATIAYWDVGDGVPLLCLHGGMGLDSATLRVPGILDLARRGIRLIIPDQRGHGLSSRTGEGTYTHAIWASDAHDLALALGLDRFALLGHSYGGFIALEYAARWPDSLTHLLLVSTSAGPVTAQTAEARTDEALKNWFRARWPLFFSRSDKHTLLLDSVAFSIEAYRAAFTRELAQYDLRSRLPGTSRPHIDHRRSR